MCRGKDSTCVHARYGRYFVWTQQINIDRFAVFVQFQGNARPTAETNDMLGKEISIELCQCGHDQAVMVQLIINQHHPKCWNENTLPHFAGQLLD